MKSRTLGRFEHDVYSWAELICMSVFVHHVEACSEIYGQRFNDLPLVLQIKTVVGTRLALIVHNGKGHIGGLTSRSVNRKNPVICLDIGRFNREEKPASQDVGIIDCPARVKLNPVGKDASVDSSCQTGEDEVTFVIWRKQSRAVASKCRQLQGDIFKRLLVRENGKFILLVLILTQETGIRILCVGPSECKEWRLSGVGGNLKIGIGATHQQAKSTGIVDEIGELCEPFVLLGIVVDRVVTASRVFDSKVILVVTAKSVKTESTFRTSNLETRRNSLVRTAVIRDVSPVQVDTFFRVNVNNAACSETKLSRE